MPPAERISRHIARILRVTATGKTLAGTGYVAPFGHLATCAHVVAFALTGSNETGPEPPQGELLFELLGEDGTIIEFRAICEAECWGPAREKNHPKTAGDYALLRILQHSTATPPEGLDAMPCTSTRQVWGFGFPNEGAHASPEMGSEAEGRLSPCARRDGLTQFHQLEAHHPFVAPGFSGAPLFALDAQGLPIDRVIGINVARNPHATGTAFMLGSWGIESLHRSLHKTVIKAMAGHSFFGQFIDHDIAAIQEHDPPRRDASTILAQVEQFRMAEMRSRNCLPEPYGTGLLGELAEDINAAFARGTPPDAEVIGGMAADLLRFLAVQDRSDDAEQDALAAMREVVREMLGAVQPPKEISARLASGGSAGEWPSGLVATLRNAANNLITASDAAIDVNPADVAPARVNAEARTIRRLTRELRPDWPRLSLSGMRIREASEASGAPLREEAAGLLAALRNAAQSRVLATPQFGSFRELPFAPEMVVLPTGEFWMGSTPEEQERFELREAWRKEESPRHLVRIEQRFALARYPVTFDEYDTFCDMSGLEKPDDEKWGRGRRPVINVSHDDAMKYCGWLSEQTGAVYRLPSEAEWEYACRSDTETAYSWGEEWDPLRANGSEGGPGQTTEVGSYAPNPWSLCDLHGNLWEWCADGYEGNYDAPRSQAAFIAPDSGSLRVLRGGSWNYYPRVLRSAGRVRDEPGIRSWVIGFRLARTLTP